MSHGEVMLEQGVSHREVCVRTVSHREVMLEQGVSHGEVMLEQGVSHGEVCVGTGCVSRGDDGGVREFCLHLSVCNGLFHGMC